jgi:hypothetical protein
MVYFKAIFSQFRDGYITVVRRSGCYPVRHFAIALRLLTLSHNRGIVRIPRYVHLSLWHACACANDDCSVVACLYTIELGLFRILVRV